ncbi:hypothetical protein NLX86_25265 [Streptomyces sp. A3M-1-3]|uniref:hypothetical protein n=1 Tax=Streptomyces sp. A3M-1-3 TaxID=2962044 RepID=UPI0020B7A14F|nr:hypothetical protein [Streptomyces sp. A3M-1-3]MCP3821282.1 hypothetical protein [Streptomyces sp. A3M-1-3]
MAALPTPLPTDAPDSRTRRGARLVLSLAAALLALPLVTAAHHSRPAPYGDHLTAHGPSARAAGEPLLRAAGGAVQAYGPHSGAPRWTYTREGRRPLGLRAAPGHAFTLWDDGMVTDSARAGGGAVRWHRAVPTSARRPAEAPARAADALQPLDPAYRMLAVVTPQRIAAYRTADGDLRWVLPARRGCAFDPHRFARAGGALLIAQPCRAQGVPWTSELVARWTTSAGSPRTADHWATSSPAAPRKQLRAPGRLSRMANLLVH